MRFDLYHFCYTAQKIETMGGQMEWSLMVSSRYVHDIGLFLPEKTDLAWNLCG